MLRNTQYSEKRTIAQPEIDLGHGRPDTGLAAIRTGWALALLLVAAGAAGALGWTWPDSGYDWNWGRAVASGLFVLISTGGLMEAGRTYRALRADETGYREYLADRRAAHLDALAEHAGQNVERQMSATEIDLGRFHDIVRLIVYAKLADRATVSEFTGPLLLQGNGRHISLGSASKYTAELATKELERIGVLEHRGDGRARTVRDGSLEELIWIAVDRWGKG